MPPPPRDDHALSVARDVAAPPDLLYTAFTTGLERWFARRGTLRFTPEVGAPYYFETDADGGHPHYGRVLRLRPGRLVELTWVTGRGGTEGAETILTVTLTPNRHGTRVTVKHRGFYSDTARDAHQAGWDQALADLDRTTHRRRDQAHGQPGQ